MGNGIDPRALIEAEQRAAIRQQLDQSSESDDLELELIKEKARRDRVKAEIAAEIQMKKDLESTLPKAKSSTSSKPVAKSQAKPAMRKRRKATPVDYSASEVPEMRPTPEGATGGVASLVQDVVEPQSEAVPQPASPDPFDSPGVVAQYGSNEEKKILKRKLLQEKSLQDAEQRFNQYTNSFIGFGHDPNQAKALATMMMESDTNIVKPLEKAAGFTFIAGETEGRARSAYWDRASGINRDAAKEYAKNLADGVRNWEDKMAQVAQMDAQISNAVVQPGRVWNNKSLFSKAAAGFSSGLYRMLQVTQGRIGGANPVVQAMQNAIQQDLAAQELELNRMFKQRAGARQGAMDELALSEFKNEALQEGLIYRLGTIEAKMKKQLMDETLPMQTRAQYFKDIAAIGQMKMEAMSKLSQGYLKRQAKKAGKGVGGGGKGSKGVGPTGLDLRPYGVTLADGSTRINLGDKTQKTDMKAALEGSRVVRQGIQNILALGTAKNLPTSRRRILAKQAAQQILAGRLLAGGRAISDADLKVIANALGSMDPDEFLTWADANDVNAKFRSALRAEQGAVTSTLQAEGYDIRINPLKPNISGLTEEEEVSSEEGNESSRKRVNQQIEEAESPGQVIAAANALLNKFQNKPNQFSWGGEGTQEYNALVKKAKTKEAKKALKRVKDQLKLNSYALTQGFIR